jgi:hypothetical protein
VKEEVDWLIDLTCGPAGRILKAPHVDISILFLFVSSGNEPKNERHSLEKSYLQVLS